MSEPSESFCALASLAIGEPLHGTAAGHTDAWLLIEHAGSWGSKAWQQAPIPEAARAHVDAWEHACPTARVQLIKRDDTRARGDLRVFLASSRQSQPIVAAVCIPRLDDLCSIDLDAAFAALQAGELPAGATAAARPLALVCTNGKRDRCCAKWGVPVFDAIRGRDDVDVWQTTHLGGHRYAATMLWLPEGLCYGRVATSEVGGLLDAALARRIAPLERLRGRTCLGEAGQAAESMLRHDHDALGFDDVVVRSEQRVGNDWRVDADVLGRPLSITLARKPIGVSAPASCGKEPEPVACWQVSA
ncbi:MAG: hypothetical protein IAG13_20365 [Deltaproteobacteria bacterium]|nr:hypothetical protein [Nannocystaceae bacterium]